MRKLYLTHGPNKTKCIRDFLLLAEFLAQRSWKGLEIKKGETQVSKAIEGRNGIASSYTHETGHSSGAEYSDEDNLIGANRLKQSECCELMATRLVSTQTT